MAVELAEVNGQAAAQPEPRSTELDMAASPREMAARLADMKTKLSLIQTFFKEVMVEGQDYGVIPGTDKPTLYKPGAEKLAELYGFGSVVRDLREEKNLETGYYRAVATVALISRRTGQVVAEGVGEANTMEGRYRWRWVPEWKLPKGYDTKGLAVDERDGRKGKYKAYRIENDDPFSLWNTVLKMAKKRAFVDAVLSATRSSGLFTQDVEDLQDWAAQGQTIDAYDVERTPTQPAARDTVAPSVTKADVDAMIAWARNNGLTQEQIRDAFQQATGRVTLRGWSHSRVEFERWKEALQDLVESRQAEQQTLDGEAVETGQQGELFVGGQ